VICFCLLLIINVTNLEKKDRKKQPLMVFIRLSGVYNVLHLIYKEKTGFLRIKTMTIYSQKKLNLVV
jgi:hypothetical protein